VRITSSGDTAPHPCGRGQPFCAGNTIWPSQASALSCHPCENGTNGPLPHSFLVDVRAVLGRDRAHGCSSPRAPGPWYLPQGSVARVGSANARPGRMGSGLQEHRGRLRLFAGHVDLHDLAATVDDLRLDPETYALGRPPAAAASPDSNSLRCHRSTRASMSTMSHQLAASRGLPQTAPGLAIQASVASQSYGSPGRGRTPVPAVDAVTARLCATRQPEHVSSAGGDPVRSERPGVVISGDQSVELTSRRLVAQP
jgi:hypothetical protein